MPFADYILYTSSYQHSTVEWVAKTMAIYHVWDLRTEIHDQVLAKVGSFFLRTVRVEYVPCLSSPLFTASTKTLTKSTDGMVIKVF